MRRAWRYQMSNQNCISVKNRQHNGREKKYKRTYNEIQNVPCTHKSKYRVIPTPLKTNDQRYVPLVVNTSRSCPHSWVITGFVTRLTRRVPLVEQEMSTLPEHLSSPSNFSGIPVTRSSTSSIYGFWLPLWYLQTLLMIFYTVYKYMADNFTMTRRWLEQKPYVVF
jgi:hypothetical protein